VDPLLLEALRFGVAFLSGGLVAVVASILSFRYAQRLQMARDELTTLTLRRALVAEVRENIRRLGGEEAGFAMPLVPLVRSAWDQARGSVELPRAAFDAILAGYQAGTYAHEVTAIVQIMLGRPWNLFEKLRVPALMEKQMESARSQSRVAREHLVKALIALGEDAESEEP